MPSEVEPFSVVVAELSVKYIDAFPNSDIITGHMDTVKQKTGAHVITGYGRNGIGIKGSWLALSTVHSLLVELLATCQAAQLADHPGVHNGKSSMDSFTHDFAKTQRSCSRKKLSRPIPGCKIMSDAVKRRTNKKNESDKSTDVQEMGDNGLKSDDEAQPESCPELTKEAESSFSQISDVHRQNVKGMLKVKLKRGRPKKQESRQTVNVHNPCFSLVKHKRKQHTPVKIAEIIKTSPSQETEAEKKTKEINNEKSSTMAHTLPLKPARKITRGRGMPRKGTDQDVRKGIDQDGLAFSCSECSYKGKSKAGLRGHMRRIHISNPVGCDVCEKIFPNALYMQRHRSSHFAPRHCCDVCGKMFKIEKAMVMHRRTHEEGYTRPIFQCEVCPKTFCSQYILDCHMKSVHMGEKRSFLCSFCGKKFTSKHSLHQHLNAHIGIKPYMCKICGKGFSYDSALRDHVFVHKEEKQFRCSQCYKTFRQRSALKMHMRIHEDTKKFQCEECGRDFTQKQALQRHERVHRGTKPFICKLCSQSFSDASIIRRHLILVHKTHKDAKTWREDIICAVKPDSEHHVKVVGDPAAKAKQPTHRPACGKSRDKARSKSASGRLRRAQNINSAMLESVVTHPSELCHMQNAGYIVKKKLLDSIQQLNSDFGQTTGKSIAVSSELHLQTETFTASVQADAFCHLDVLHETTLQCGSDQNDNDTETADTTACTSSVPAAPSASPTSIAAPQSEAQSLPLLDSYGGLAGQCGVNFADINPLVHATTGAVNSMDCCMHKGVNDPYIAAGALLQMGVGHVHSSLQTDLHGHSWVKTKGDVHPRSGITSHLQIDAASPDTVDRNSLHISPCSVSSLPIDRQELSLADY